MTIQNPTSEQAYAWHEKALAEWRDIALGIATMAYEAGVKNATKASARKWPEPFDPEIVGPPTEVDADDLGLVQVLLKGNWQTWDWSVAAAGASTPPWLHTPRWKPPVPLTEQEQALEDLEWLWQNLPSSFDSAEQIGRIRSFLEERQ